MSDPKLILYKLKNDWSLPSSISIGCLQVEAYLRLAKLKFAVQDCTWGSSSPTGQVPALDTEGGNLIGAENAESVISELEGAKAIISHLQRQTATNLDSHLSPANRAEALAFSTLIETKLIPALLYTTWCESEAYSKLTSVAMGKGLPFPLNYWLPYSARKGVRAHLEGKSGEEIYDAACSVLDAVAAKLISATTDGYFFGDEPSSLDTFLFACLAYLRTAPVIHPDLRKKFISLAPLGRYVDRIGTGVFSKAVPSATNIEMKWSPWSASGGTGSRSSNKASTELNRKGKLWLMGAGAAVVAYILLSGQYIDVTYGVLGELGEDDDYEDEE